MSGNLNTAVMLENIFLLFCNIETCHLESDGATGSGY